MFGTKSGRSARQDLAVFRDIFFETLDIFVIDVVDVTLTIFANTFFCGTAIATDFIVAVVGFDSVFILIHNDLCS